MADRTAERLVPWLLALTATTGLIDAVSVLALGRVFTANMTGNVVFLGFALVGTPGYAVAPALLALACFLAGAAAGGRLTVVLGHPALRTWVFIAGGFEGLLLAGAGCLAIGYDVALLHPEPIRYALIALTAVAMGFRNATVRQLKVADLTTTVLTLTLTGVAADSSLGGGDGSGWRRRLAAVTSMLAGAAIGAILVLRFGPALPLFAAAIIAFAGSLLVARRIA